MKPAILFAHMRGSDEMAESLLRLADVEIVVAYDAVGPHFEARGLPYTRLFEFLSDEASRRLVVEARVRAEDAAARLHDDVLARHWPHLTDATRREVTRRFAGKFEEEFLNSALLIDCVTLCAQQRDLRAVLVPQDISRDTKSITFAAQRLGVPVVHLLHGYPGGTANLHEDCYADWIAVFSDSTARMYAEFGMPRDRIRITGNPYWDNFCRPPRRGSRRNVYAGLGLKPDKPIIVLVLLYGISISELAVKLPGYATDTTEAAIKALGELSAKYPDWQFIVRPHPNMPDYHGDLAARAEAAGIRNVLVDSKASPMAVCSVADVIVGTESNMGIEAAFYGVPVVNLVIEEFAGPFFREGMGRIFTDGLAVQNVTKVEDIVPAIERLVTDNAAKTELASRRPVTLERFNKWHDGHASRRFSDFLVDVMATVSDKPVNHTMWAAALDRAVPESATRIGIVGDESNPLVRALAVQRSEKDIRLVSNTEPTADTAFECIVMTEPLRHHSYSLDVLRAARSSVQDDGTVVLFAYSGAYADALESFACRAWAPPRTATARDPGPANFSLHGLRLMLSRSGWSVEHVEPYLSHAMVASGAEGDENHGVEGWALRARKRALRRTTDAKRAAAAANRLGEEAMGHHDIPAALAHFERAIDLDPANGLYHNNWATAIYSRGDAEQAWQGYVTALHYCPTSPAARENLAAVAGALGREREAEAICAFLPPAGEA